MQKQNFESTVKIYTRKLLSQFVLITLSTFSDNKPAVIFLKEDIDGSFLCVFDVIGSRILLTVQIPYKVHYFACLYE